MGWTAQERQNTRDNIEPEKNNGDENVVEFGEKGLLLLVLSHVMSENEIIIVQ